MQPEPQQKLKARAGVRRERKTGVENRARSMWRIALLAAGLRKQRQMFSISLPPPTAPRETDAPLQETASVSTAALSGAVSPSPSAINMLLPITGASHLCSGHGRGDGGRGRGGGGSHDEGSCWKQLGSRGLQGGGRGRRESKA